MFDPYGWHPEAGLDAAIALLGWSCERSDGGTPAEALERLQTACSPGPVLVGPVDMGMLLYQPGTPNAEGGDHYVVVLAVDQDGIELHAPHGHPASCAIDGSLLPTPVPPGSLGGAAAEALSDMVARGTPPGIRTLLTAFGVRTGAHRLNDAATCLEQLGLSHAASVAQRRARILGGLQYPLVHDDDRAAAAVANGRGGPDTGQSRDQPDES
ncbi:hypothetical protein OG723_02690 [Streptomyces sp. NBC_01278]|uniref:hypothetical protein n=1 Tax=Streptomyces sp. NBC_01278 TaxID=2903809 RepID=UPI002E2F68C2|nr:hypothetical protein [Streptomyces sp. NBC_01278]